MLSATGLKEGDLLCTKGVGLFVGGQLKKTSECLRGTLVYAYSSPLLHDVVPISAVAQAHIGTYSAFADPPNMKN